MHGMYLGRLPITILIWLPVWLFQGSNSEMQNNEHTSNFPLHFVGLLHRRFLILMTET